MSESHKIKGQERSYDYGYKNFNFSALRFGFNNSESLINYDGFTLKDYIGNEIFTGIELLYYPELAKVMRESIKEYPTMIRRYEVDKDISGAAFFNYLSARLNEVATIFENELSNAKGEIEKLVTQYGQAKTPIIVNSIIEADWNWKKGLVINGVEWLFKTECKTEEILTVINMRQLLNLSYRDFEKVQLEDAIIGSPYVAFRIGKTWSHTGSLHWYNLDTMQEVKKSDIAKWKKP